MKKTIDSTIKATVMMAICVLTLCLTSCSSDDDPNYEVNQNLIGTWQLEQIKLNGQTADVHSKNCSITFTEEGACSLQGEWGGDGIATYRMRGHIVEIIESGELTGYIKFITLDAHTATFMLIPIEDDDEIDPDILYVCSKFTSL